MVGNGGENCQGFRDIIGDHRAVASEVDLGRGRLVLSGDVI